MNLYVVRHGESRENISGVFEGVTSPLTEKGESQAAFVAERFKSIPVDIILASEFLRAQKTAEAIGNAIGKEVTVVEDLFGEAEPPQGLLGKHNEDPEWAKVFDAIYDNFHTPGWRHSGEENFEDLKDRALKALAYIDSLEVENVLLVTHGKFLRMLTACVIMGPELTSYEFFRFYMRLVTKNTGITKFTKKPMPSKKRESHAVWRLVAWNDHAHLGEVM